MKPYSLLLLILVIFPFLAQSQLGLKAGPNFAKVTKASGINANNSTGFHAGIFLAPASKPVLGYRSELIFSRQGYDFKSGNTTGTVALDYILLPQLLQINITKIFAVQVGGQMAFLLNAKADSTTHSTGNAQFDKLIDIMNRFDYGLAGGLEVHPVKGLLLGARINVSLGNLFKELPTGASRPNYFPEIDAKNNVVQLFAGYRFGKK